MAELNWMVFCERAVVDSSSNSLSLMNILEEVHMVRPSAEQIKAAAGRRIAVPLACTVVTNWERSDPTRAEGSAKVMLRLVDPKGKALIESTLLLDLGKASRARLFVNLQAMPAETEGTYIWRVHLHGKKRWQPVGEVSYLFEYVESVADVERLQKAARRSAARFADDPNLQTRIAGREKKKLKS